MEFWLFFGIIVAGITVYNIGKDKLNEKERLAANKAATIRLYQEEKTAKQKHLENLSAKKKLK